MAKNKNKGKILRNRGEQFHLKKDVTDKQWEQNDTERTLTTKEKRYVGISGKENSNKENQEIVMKMKNEFSSKNASTLETKSEAEIQNQYVSKSKMSDLHSFNEQKEVNPSSFQEEKHKKRMRKQMKLFHETEQEGYDSVSKDMGNDEAIDRYDVDVRDSKMSYKAVSKEEKGRWNNKKQRIEKTSGNLEKKIQSKKKRYYDYANKETSKTKEQQKTYCKSNFEEQEFTRNQENKSVNKETQKAEKHSKKTAKKFEKQEKKLSKLKHKKQDFEKKSGDKKNLSAKSAMVAIGAVNQYLESGKEDNAGIDAAQKVTDRAEHVARKLHHNGQKKALKKQKKSLKLSKKIEKQERKLFFKKNMEELKSKAQYQNTSKLRQFFKRKQYKKQIRKKYQEQFKKGTKNIFMQIAKKLAELVKARGKKVIFLILIIAGIFFMLFQAGSMMMNMGTGMVGNTISTTYLSPENTLREINQEFSSLEQALKEEMDSVEEHHPGYDEYIVKGKEKIGHDVHELLSYITARYGVVKEVSEIESELQNLFHQMYRLTYKEEIEIRYRTETITHTDEQGNEQTTTIEVPYEYTKLIVNLEKREMDAIIREIFQPHPNNLSHYETLLASKGNMGSIFGNGSGNLSEIINNPDFGNPGLEFNEESVKRIVEEAEKHIGKRYVFGANGPDNFDCSSFVCWVYTHSNIKNMPRTTAWGIYKNYCNPVSPSDAKPGDIIFFKNTYDSGSPISHVGIYVGGGYMIHAGDPIQYTSINTKYWQEHFYGFGRP